MSFIFNRNASLTAGQTAPVMPSLSASPSLSKPIKLAWIAVVALFAMSIGTKGLLAPANADPEPLNPGTGTLTVKGVDNDARGTVLDVDAASGKSTSGILSSDFFRAKNGETVTADLGNIEVFPKGSTSDGIMVAKPEFLESFSAPILSPDGKFVAVWVVMPHKARNGEGTSTYLYKRDGTFVHGYGDFHPEDWTPDGRLVLTYDGNNTNIRGGVVVLNRDFAGGTPASKLTHCENVSVSPDGRRLAYQWHTHIWVANIDGSEPRQVTTSAEDETWPTWSPDGKWLAINIGLRIYLVSPDKTQQKPTRYFLDDTKKWVVSSGRMNWR